MAVSKLLVELVQMALLPPMLAVGAAFTFTETEPLLVQAPLEAVTEYTPSLERVALPILIVAAVELNPPGPLQLNPELATPEEACTEKFCPSQTGGGILRTVTIGWADTLTEIVARAVQLLLFTVTEYTPLIAVVAEVR